MTDVTEYEIFELPPRLMFLRLETEEGTVGWGEPTVGAYPGVVRAAIERLVEEFVVGESALSIEDRWQEMYRGLFYRGGPVLMGAMGAIDQALWDLKGRELGVPVYELLGGGVRDRVKVYQWITGETPEDARDVAVQEVERGFDALKLGIGAKLRHIDAPERVDEVVRRFEAVREAVGPEIEVGIDLHGRTSEPVARRILRELEPYDPMFVEEPVRPEHADALPDLAGTTTCPLATGERVHTRFEFDWLLGESGIDVVQPSIPGVGGLSELRRIAAAADLRNVVVAPHSPLGPVGFATCLQFDVATPNVLIQQHHRDVIDAESGGLFDYASNRAAFALEDGYIEPPSRPGIGIDVDESLVRERSALDFEFSLPRWRHDDGSVAEW